MMAAQHELKTSDEFQKFVTEIGHELRPSDVQTFKVFLRGKLPHSVLYNIDSSEKDSGLELLSKLQEYGCLAENNLELLQNALHISRRTDLLKNVKDFKNTATDVKEREQVGEGISFI
jgi:hypothetical protein